MSLFAMILLVNVLSCKMSRDIPVSSMHCAFVSHHCVGDCPQFFVIPIVRWIVETIEKVPNLKRREEMEEM